MIDTDKTTVTKAQPKAESSRHRATRKTKAPAETFGDTFVVVDGRGGISVDLDRMLSSEKGKRSIEKLRKVRVQKNKQ